MCERVVSSDVGVLVWAVSSGGEVPQKAVVSGAGGSQRSNSWRSSVLKKMIRKNNIRKCVVNVFLAKYTCYIKGMTLSDKSVLFT